MHLPQIQMIGLKPPQRLLQHARRSHTFAAVRADLGHQKDFVSAPLQAFAHPVFGLSAVIFPAVVKERDAAIHCFLDDANGRLLFVFRVSQVMPTEAQGRDLWSWRPKGLMGMPPPVAVSPPDIPSSPDRPRYLPSMGPPSLFPTPATRMATDARLPLDGAPMESDPYL